jgi:hypothetical protein
MSIVIIPLPIGHQQSGPKPESGTASLFIPYGKCLSSWDGFSIELNALRAIIPLKYV